MWLGALHFLPVYAVTFIVGGFWEVLFAMKRGHGVNEGFFVTSSGELAITHILNYPNPCSSFTHFVFEHNRPDEMLDIRIDIFSLNGQLIKTISKSVMSTGFRDKSISWSIDNSIRRGIYIYRLSVKSQTDNSISEKTEKLIIVR